MNRYKTIIKNAITAYVYELDSQDYESDQELYHVLLREFGMSDNEFVEIMGMTFAQWR